VARAAAAQCAPDNGGITLPQAFCATVFADGLGQARHIAVTQDGTVYVNTWRSPYRKNAKIPPGGFLVALRDDNRDGVAETVRRFGEGSESGASGGTGIALHRGYLYAEEGERIVRYPLLEGGLVPRGEKEVIVDRLPAQGDHTMHPFAISRDGALYVNSGSPSNACQVKNRAPRSPGKDPCDELDRRAGIWEYDSTVIAQIFDVSGRYASGLRNNVALAMHPTSGLFTVTHGRDQLHENWPERFDVLQGAPTMAGPTAITTAASGAISSRRSMAATLAAPTAAATGPSPWRASRRTGRRTRCSSTPASRFRTDTGTAPSSPSTARGTGRGSRATTWCSCRWIWAAMPPATRRSSPTASPAR
jgi:hypothetical protein